MQLPAFGLRTTLACAVLGGVLGATAGDMDTAVLGAVVGFFVGKSLRSTARTFAVGSSE